MPENTQNSLHYFCLTLTILIPFSFTCADHVPVNDTVWVFLGDSITAANLYTDYVETYYHLRYPKLKFHFRNEGRGGATISESTIGGRYEKRVMAYQPNVVSVMFGHAGNNDVDQYDSDLYDLINNYIIGMNSAEPLLLGPHPNYPSGKDYLEDFTSRLILIGQLLNLKYADIWHHLQPVWLENSQSDTPIDLQHVDPSHPGPAGHQCISYSILLSLDADDTVNSAIIDAKKGIVKFQSGCQITNLKSTDNEIDLYRLNEWLPMAIDDDARNAFDLIPEIWDFNRFLLTIIGLENGYYDVYVDDEYSDTVHSDVLGAGWNMAQMTNGPIYDQLKEVLNKVRFKEGIDPITRESLGPPWIGVRAYQSAADYYYHSKSLRGNDLSEALWFHTENLYVYDRHIHSAAQPRNRHFSIRKSNLSYKPTWNPPLGIPRPEFGVEETYRIYDNLERRNPDMMYQKNSEGGCYTHFIDNTHPDATDQNNAYGSILKPRETIPWDLLPGSIVQVQGGPYSNDGNPYLQNWTWFTGSGTREQPIFIRGMEDSIPVFTKMNLRVGGSYIIIENLEFDDCTIGIHTDRISDHIAIRNLEVYGGPPIHATAISAGTGHHIVIYNNYIHDNGDPNWIDENDFHGVTAGTRNGRHAENVWIVDNHMHGNGGDSIQINSGPVPLDQVARHIYIGRNIMHHEGENAIDLKQCADVIISQNIMYGFDPTQFTHSGSDGTALVVNGDVPKEQIWIIFNDIHDSINAIRAEQDAYIIGNKIFNIFSDPENHTGGQAVVTWPAHNLYVIGNTMHDICGGIKHSGGGAEKAVYVHNNIISLAADGDYHIDLTGDVSGNSIISFNLFQSDSGKAIINWDGLDTKWDLAQFQQATTQGIGCIEGDSGFYDPDNNDFRLEIASLAIDAGTSEGLVRQVFDTFINRYRLDIRKDFNANPRPMKWDIGAFEFDPDDKQAPVAAFSAFPDLSNPLDIDYNALATWLPEGGKPQYRWDFGDGFSRISSSATVSHRYQQTGVYTVKLTVIDLNDPALNSTTIKKIDVDMPVLSVDTEYLYIGPFQNKAQITLMNDAKGCIFYTLENTEEWIRLSKAVGVLARKPDPITLEINRQSMDPGCYSAEIIVDAGLAGVQTIYVEMNVPQTHSEIIIEESERWHYFKGKQTPPEDWMTNNFSDDSWTTGPTGIGYSDNLILSTDLMDMADQYSSLYLRKSFDIPDITMLIHLELRVRYDDGFVAYINGQEVARSTTMELVGKPIQHDTLADSKPDAFVGEEFFEITLDSELLETGQNILALELHNDAIDSAQAYIIPRLIAHIIEGNRADLNFDQSVNVLDFVQLSKHWLQEGMFLAEDITKDRNVNHLDLQILTQEWLWHN